MPPAMEVSGMPAFRGGGGCVSREYGWYAVLVCIFRFEDICEACRQEKVRRALWQTVDRAKVAVGLRRIRGADILRVL